MKAGVFFGFDYENDLWRVNHIKKYWINTGGAKPNGITGLAAFENLKQGGESAINKWIDEELSGTSVTVILIGIQTNNRSYLKSEIQKSYDRGNGVLGIYIHRIKNNKGKNSFKGSNHFGEIGRDVNGNAVYFSSNYCCYDWVDDDGINNIGNWIEAAANKAAKKIKV